MCSSSLDINVTKDFSRKGGCVITIKNAWGYDIQPFSSESDNEAEILIPIGIACRILSFTKQNGVDHVVVEALDRGVTLTDDELPEWVDDDLRDRALRLTI